MHDVGVSLKINENGMQFLQYLISKQINRHEAIMWQFLWKSVRLECNRNMRQHYLGRPKGAPPRAEQILLTYLLEVLLLSTV